MYENNFSFQPADRLSFSENGMITPARIFIVEDENIVALDMQKRLEKLGYTVPGIASTGRDAVRRVLELCPDLVLMDIRLAGDMDGIEAAEKILEKLFVPIVYITAYTEEATLRRAKITEPFGYILKPFEERELHINIEIALYRHKLQNVLREREQLFGTTLKSIDDAVITTNMEDRIVFLNPKAEYFTGYNASEGGGKLLYDVVAVYDRATDEKVNLLALDEGTSPLLTCISKKGDQRTVKANIAPILGNDSVQAGNVIILHDITARERAEIALRESEERYRQFFEDNLAGDFISTIHGEILTCNTSFAEILGFENAEEVMRYNLATFFPDFLKPGAFLDILVKERSLKYFNAQFVGRDNKPLFITANVVAEFSEAGELELIKGFIIDNTEQHRIEEQLLQSQKMEGIGRLAGGIAHDFNNLLGAIIGYADLLLDTLPDDDPISNDIESIRKAGRKAAALTRQLLAFSRRQVLQPKVIDLNILITDLEKMLKRLLPEHIKLFTVLDDDVWRIKVDPIQIEQVIMNLAVNARDAMPEGGKLTISSSNVTVHENNLKDNFSIQLGHYVLLKVSDTGSGIAENIKHRIFEPFFTTKEPGKGTGLGLSTVYGIVKQSEGFIFAESTGKIGTSFYVYLPRSLTKAEKIEKEEPKRESFSLGTESILLVEDEEVFRDMVHRVLEKLGYNVLEASNPGEAILICEQYKGKIDLLITDIVMPHLSGVQLADRLVSIRDDMRVLYISGYFENAVDNDGNFQKDSYFLQKPFSPAELEKVVRKILDI
ncbi:MAG: response regulator [Spirochaetales bacterium]|nr:response regulator [Spirochaetales bacterium]